VKEVFMARFTRREVEEAFAHYWRTGCVEEDWQSWANLFTPDVVYTDYFWGEIRGRNEVSVWIDAVMAGVPEIYTVLDWYAIDDDRVVFHCQNRRDNPHSEGPGYWDFPGLSVLTYGGDGQWSAEEDFWDVKGARTTSVAYANACRLAGDPSPEQRLTRRYWPDGPGWAQTSRPPAPSWLNQSGVRPIRRPGELRELLASQHAAWPATGEKGLA
jgi:hypothetical protein